MNCAEWHDTVRMRHTFGTFDFGEIWFLVSIFFIQEPAPEAHKSDQKSNTDSTHCTYQECVGVAVLLTRIACWYWSPCCSTHWGWSNYLQLKNGNFNIGWHFKHRKPIMLPACQNEIRPISSREIYSSRIVIFLMSVCHMKPCSLCVTT